jgi:hypothetical protein
MKKTTILLLSFMMLISLASAAQSQTLSSCMRDCGANWPCVTSKCPKVLQCEDLCNGTFEACKAKCYKENNLLPRYPPNPDEKNWNWELLSKFVVTAWLKIQTLVEDRHNPDAHSRHYSVDHRNVLEYRHWFPNLTHHYSESKANLGRLVPCSIPYSRRPHLRSATYQRDFLLSFGQSLFQKEGE